MVPSVINIRVLPTLKLDENKPSENSKCSMSSYGRELPVSDTYWRKYNHKVGSHHMPDSSLRHHKVTRTSSSGSRVLFPSSNKPHIAGNILTTLLC